MDLLSILRNLGTEARVSVFFAAVALFFSILLGIINGINIGSVIIRTIFLTAVFAGLGFAVITVLKKFVPEFYSLLGNAAAQRPDTDEKETAGAEAAPDAGIEKPTAEEPSVETGGSAPITALNDDEFNKMLGDGGADSKRKLGKHIISNEKIVSYEPKIMAQAVRTMMRRDED